MAAYRCPSNDVAITLTADADGLHCQERSSGNLSFRARGDQPRNAETHGQRKLAPEPNSGADRQMAGRLQGTLQSGAILALFIICRVSSISRRITCR
jgi:hypothetical protein